MPSRRCKTSFIRTTAVLFCLLTCLAATWGNIQEAAVTHLPPHFANAPHATFSGAQQHGAPRGNVPVTFEAFDVDDSDEFSAHKLIPSSPPWLLKFILAGAGPKTPARRPGPLENESPLVCHLDSLRTTVLLI